MRMVQRSSSKIFIGGALDLVDWTSTASRSRTRDRNAGRRLNSLSGSGETSFAPAFEFAVWSRRNIFVSAFVLDVWKHASWIGIACASCRSVSCGGPSIARRPWLCCLVQPVVRAPTNVDLTFNILTYGTNLDHGSPCCLILPKIRLPQTWIMVSLCAGSLLSALNIEGYGQTRSLRIRS